MTHLFSVDPARLAALESARAGSMGAAEKARQRLNRAWEDLRRAREELEEAKQSGRRIPARLGEAITAAQREVERLQAEVDVAVEQRNAAGRLFERARAHAAGGSR